MKKAKFKYKLVLLLGFTLLLTGCGRFEYRGDYPELYSVALSSILGQRGYESVSFGSIPPRIIVHEEDRYGRIMFSYSEGHDRYISSANRVIVQRVEGEYVYFYPHYNFISRQLGHGVFSDEEIETFKEANSWNQPMSDSSEFVRVRIVRQKEDGPVSNAQLLEAYREVFPGSNPSRAQMNYRMIFLRTDDYGRSVYLATHPLLEEPYIAIVFQPDHSFNIEIGALEIEDPNNYQTALRLLMEANGWNEPWEE